MSKCLILSIALIGYFIGIFFGGIIFTSSCVPEQENLQVVENEVEND